MGVGLKTSFKTSYVAFIISKLPRTMPEYQWLRFRV